MMTGAGPTELGAFSDHCIADTTLSAPARIINELFVLSGPASVAIISLGSERVESFKEEVEEVEEVMMRSCTAFQRRFSRQLRMFECDVWCTAVLGTVLCCVQTTECHTEPVPVPSHHPGTDS